MLADELREKLKKSDPDLETIENFWKQSGNEATFERLYAQSQDEHLWQNPQQATILKSLQKKQQSSKSWNIV